MQEILRTMASYADRDEFMQVVLCEKKPSLPPKKAKAGMAGCDLALSVVLHRG